MKRGILDMPPGSTSMAEIKAWRESTDYVYQKADELVALAYAGYRAEGRGVLMVGFAYGDERGVPLTYAPAAAIRDIRKPLGSSATKSLERNVKLYDPEYSACLCIIVHGDLTRTMIIQSQDAAKDLFAVNADQYLAQMESRADWLKKWGDR